MPEEQKIPILSFFAGGGFMDMGFVKAGFDIVWTNEFDLVFAELYKQGMTSWQRNRNNDPTGTEHTITNTNSLKDISSPQILVEAFEEEVPKIFGMTGGPPCQDFSINGNLEGFKGEKGSLTDAFLCKILDLQPAFFIMENVTGLLRVKENAKHFLFLLDILKEIYMIDFSVLNSLDFGVPQSRERVFVVGINKNIYNLSDVRIGLNGQWFPFPQGSQHSQHINAHPWPVAADFGAAAERPDGIPLNLCVESCLVPQAQEKTVANGGEYFNLYITEDRLRDIREGETNRPSFKRLHRYKYSPTTCYGNNEVHLHPYLHRRLSVREALRIQSVEDSYVLSPQLPLSKKFKMIGNGVPVLLAEAVGNALHQFLKTLPVI
jgi:DNA (cytosine-5)-methyltransferase 1